MPPILLYDGVCGLCNRFVQFVIYHDRQATFRFASLQSPMAAKILTRHNVKASGQDTVYVVVNAGVANAGDDPAPQEYLLNRSSAVIFILQQLGAPWRRAASILKLFPQPLRDLAYNTIARYRYRIFGRSETCILPKPEFRERFID